MAASIVVGDTKTFTLIARLKKVPWNLVGATVLLYLQKPDGTVVTLTGTGISGGATYGGNASTLSVPGEWAHAWHCDDGTNSLTTTPFPFTVSPNLGG